MRHAPLDPSDWPALAQVLGESFGLPPERWAGFRARIGDTDLRTVHVGGRVAGGLGVYRMGQVFAGNRVSLGGFLGEELRWYGPASDPLLALLPEQTAKVDEVQRWMIRILDVRRALEARGWSADGELHLHVDDPLFPENTGPWIMAVQEGVAAVRRGGTGALRTGIRGLAPLYTALFTPRTLARIGWIEGDERTLSLAARMFSAPAPWMPDMY